MTRKALERKIEALYPDTRTDVYKGHMMDGRYGWIMRPFGQNEVFLGKNLREANEEVQNKLDYRSDFAIS